MARQQAAPSLTLTGGLAAVYPSEDQLWQAGPTINDPGAQGVAGPVDNNGAGARLPAPISSQDALQTDKWIDETLNGPTSNGAYAEDWVNLAITGRPGYGSFNEQPFFSGHTQIVQSNPASEQGWGVGPARRWAHYPFSELQNPTRNNGAHMRNGQLPWVTNESSYSRRTAEAWQQQWAPYKQRGPVNPVVPVASTVPFVQTVPTYAGGPVAHRGVDIPDSLGAGVY